MIPDIQVDFSAENRRSALSARRPSDRRAQRLRSLLGLLLAGSLAAIPAAGSSVLMISVDGMKPEYVLDADLHGLKIPFLRSLVRNGTYARVTGVWPTVTYPSHTTLLTGVSPAQHGIYNNLEFDPRHLFGEAWYWYAPRIRVATLWQVAHEAGLSTASVGWPVSVDAPVDTLIPEYWRLFHPTADLDPSDTALISALSRPNHMLDDMQARLGPYMSGNDPSPAGDEIKTRFALDILRAHKPAFMTLHLSALDEEEHLHGLFSAEANTELEAIDGFLAQLFAAARANDPDAIALVVSDHGFVTITHLLNLQQAFSLAGFSPSDGRWRAQPWGAGGMAAIMLKEPDDAATQAQVRELLQRLKGDARNGIAEILERGAIAARGAFPGAAFLVVMREGFSISGNAGTAVLTEVPGMRGSHGFSPEYPAMRAAFFMAGAGIARHRDLGLIDMRQIAPTVAQILGLHLPAASEPALNVRP